MLIAALTFTTTVLYIASLPRNLGHADESVYLYEAKRVLEGAVLYRDLFEIITPGWMLLMAALFRVFGTDLATARLATAVLHGLTGVVLYLTCRRLGVRRGLSWPVPLAYLVVCQPAWPIASQHWLSTFLCAVLLLLCAGRGHARVTWPLGPGIVIGLIVAVQQQRGVVMGAGVLVWLTVDHVLRRLYRVSSPPLAPQLAALVGGALLVVVPLLAFMVTGAGFDHVWRALVVHPLVNYRVQNHCPWGYVGVFTAGQASFTFPFLLECLPLALVVASIRLGLILARRDDVETAGKLALLVVFGGFSILSILYYPDFIHIAFIAPVLFVTGAESLEWAVRRLPAAPAMVRACGALAGAILVLAGAMRLDRNLVRGREVFRFTRWTAFGRVDLASPVEVDLYDELKELLGTGGPRELYCYPIISHLYLMLDARNPTPYLFTVPGSGYTDTAQVEEIIAALEARRLPYIVALKGGAGVNDPILAYIERNYAPLSDNGVGRGIYRRRMEPRDP